MMSTELPVSDQDAETETEGSSPGAPKGTHFLKKGYRDLEEVELATPTAVRFLLNENDRLKEEIAELKPYRENSFRLQTEVAVLKEKTKSALAFEILSSAA